MKYLVKVGRYLPISLSIILINPGQVLAIPVRTIYSQDAQSIQSNGVELRIWKGYGVTINFIPTGEIIKQVWIGDPSRISFTSNGNLCPKETNQDCDGGATVLFLRQIQPINFPHLTSSQDGNTQITILTTGNDGQKQYQFKLIPATGQPQYTSLIIKPDSEKPLPVVNKPVAVAPKKPLTVASHTQVVAKKPPSADETPIQRLTVAPANAALNQQLVTVRRTAKPTGTTLQRDDANALVYGLALARQQGTIKPNSPTWKKFQDAIKLLRQGESRKTAIARTGVNADLLNQLIEAGKL